MRKQLINGYVSSRNRPSYKSLDLVDALVDLTTEKAVGGSAFFLMLAGICVVIGIFFYFFLPETKGRSLGDMSVYFAEITGNTSILDAEAKIFQEHEKSGSIPQRRVISFHTWIVPIVTGRDILSAAQDSRSSSELSALFCWPPDKLKLFWEWFWMMAKQKMIVGGPPFVSRMPWGLPNITMPLREPPSNISIRTTQRNLLFISLKLVMIAFVYLVTTHSDIIAVRSTR
jgi:hypothetical protein